MLPDKEKLEEIIKELKNNKALGKDSIVAELLKYAGEKVLKQLEKLFQEIWQTEEIQSNWKDAIIHNNYRRISLLCCIQDTVEGNSK